MGWSRVYRSGKLEPYRAMGDSVASDVVAARMAEDPDSEVRCVAAVNQHIPADVRDRLVGDPDHRVRGLVASCWGDPPGGCCPSGPGFASGGAGGGREGPLGPTRSRSASGRGSRPGCTARGCG